VLPIQSNLNAARFDLELLKDNIKHHQDAGDASELTSVGTLFFAGSWNDIDSYSPLRVILSTDKKGVATLDICC
jgi:hypothetical protein